MQFVAVDIGNSSIKIAIDHDRLDQRWCGARVFRDGDAFEFGLDESPAFWSVCSVNRRRNQMLQDWLRANRPADHYHVIDQNEIGIRSDVDSRGQVGLDRLIAAWMAIKLNDNVGPVVIVDAGTAVTIDYVDRRLVFRGGVIFPGPSANLWALAHTTEALPDLSHPDHISELGNLKKELIGYSTRSAMLRGVYHSQINSIKSIVASLVRTCSENVSIYATGGGVPVLEKYLPQHWNFVPDLVLQGARAIGHQLEADRIADP
jgi:type III pantothenate kinase